MKNILYALIVLLISSCSDSKKISPYPQDQEIFLKELTNFSNQYRNNENGAFRTQLRMKRSNWLKSYFQANKNLTNWTGWIKEINTSSVDNSIEIKLEFQGYYVTIQTTNNFISDNASPGQKTMIDFNSDFGKKIIGFNIGQKVRFSGNFFPDEYEDGITEMSITESGSMLDPEFLFFFSDINPI